MKQKGINNYGQICYLDSILQVITNLQSSRKFIQQIDITKQQKDIDKISSQNGKNDQQKAVNVQFALQQFINNYLIGKEDTMNPLVVTNSLGLSREQLLEQEDADGFYLQLVDYLSKQTDKRYLKQYQQTYQLDKHILKTCSRCQFQEEQQMNEVNTRLSARQSFFHSLQIINEPLQQPGFCDNCLKDVTKSWEVTYTKLPDILDYTIERFQYNQFGQIIKNSDQIIMPLMIDMTFQNVRQYFSDYDQLLQDEQRLLLQMLIQPWLYFEVDEEKIKLQSRVLHSFQQSEQLYKQLDKIYELIIENKQIVSHIIKYYKNSQPMCFLNVKECNIIDSYMPGDIFKTNEIPDDLYLLRMIVHHMGTAEGGHYYVSNLYLADNQICCVILNDQNVSAVDDDELLQSIGYQFKNADLQKFDTPYKYFYERFKNIKQLNDLYISGDNTDEVKQQLKIYKNLDINKSKINYLTNIKDGKTQIFGDQQIYKYETSQYCQVDQLLEELASKHFENIQQINQIKIYAVRDLNDPISARYYRIFSTKENDARNLNVYQLAVLSQQLYKPQQLQFFIEFNVEGQQDQYDENKNYVKLEEIKFQHQQFKMFEQQQKFVNDNTFVQFNPVQKYILIDKNKKMPKEEALRQIKQIIGEQVQHIYAKTFRYPNVENITEFIDNSYSVIYYSFDKDEVMIQQFCKIGLKSPNSQDSKIIVPQSFTIQQIKQQIFEQFQLLDIRQIQFNIQLDQKQEKQLTIGQIKEKIIDTTFMINFNFQLFFQNKYINVPIEKDNLILGNLIQQVVQDDISDYKIAVKHQNGELKFLEDYQGMSSFKLFEYIQPSIIIKIPKDQKITAEIYVIIQEINMKQSIIQLVFDNTDKSYKYIFDKQIKPWLIENQQQYFGMKPVLKQIVVFDGIQEYQVKLQDTLRSTKVASDQIKIGYLFELNDEF